MQRGAIHQVRATGCATRKMHWARLAQCDVPAARAPRKQKLAMTPTLSAILIVSATLFSIGLLAALEWAKRHGRDQLHVRSDSLLLVQQMLGRYKVKHAGLVPLHARAAPGRRDWRRHFRARRPRAQRARGSAGERRYGRCGERALSGVEGGVITAAILPAGDPSRR